ncbi:3-mercaptopyruvate sulfurtransferase [Cohaesibacter gelatinilyticus]|uniref:3-mercaptopyruvate sulfurtransferase n=1 Tax=Cohaesibacter gelatinilyticus TaxID=372072 RepID=A0A285NDK6_9HYPH|nr:3-mercaptopyruvate sulfurtransferase [Cohaesibacter gelatinilyticus]SNZ07509.1 thiosulfate/3-mercaptopyruvate sulfurtransferase [Cohaesibacter gelatinilyticus]
MGERTKWLVSTEWLAAHLNSPDVVVVDGSWYLPHMERDPIAEYQEAHIPGAIFFDIDKVADLTTDLPHMLPSAVQFSSAMRKLGIGDGQRVVVYDGMGLFSAARVWWTFRTMGVQDVYVLDGGLPKWKEEDRPVDDLPPVPRPRHFSSRLDHGAVRDFKDVLKAMDDERIQIVDARPHERWKGLAPEPRPNVRSGRIPGSHSVPFMDLLDDKGRLKDVSDLKDRFEKAGVDLDKPIITSCGSGATAAVLSFALDTIGHRKHSLYDGAWAEWGAKDDSPLDSDS